MFSRSLLSCFSVLFRIMIFYLGKTELVYILLIHVFVYFACVTLCLFSLPLGVMDWLQFVIVALPGLLI